MGDELYINYWKGLLPQVIEQFKSGKSVIQLPVQELSNFGKRSSYYSNFRIINTTLETPQNAHAQGRDLFEVLKQNEYFQGHFSDTTIQVTISKDLHLKIEILPTQRPDFFTEEDFELLNKYVNKEKNATNTGHIAVYDALKKTYFKIEYWANEVQKKVFPKGNIHTIKKPTNRANRFENYLWSKIYPDKESWDTGFLAFTLSIDSDWQFVIKIDTVGLNGDEKKERYEQIRGDFYNSPIVRIFSSEEILSEGWDHLITLSSKIIEVLKPEFDKLYSILNNKSNSKNLIEAPKMALNTILYGPPGTGKTYNTFSKAITIANPAFNPGASPEERKAEYQRLIQEKQIRFVTFHQNYSYEDFIIGIRPDLEDDEMKFIRHEGIFFKICKDASKNYQDNQAGITYVEPSFEEVFDKFLEPLTERDEPITLKTKSGNSSFNITKRNPKNLNFEKAGGRTDHTLSLTTLREIYTGERIYDNQGLGVYYYPLVDRLKQDAKKSREEVGRIPLKNYVLIIDEINRANISRVFGELITLLEADKRIGGAYELKVTLPNGEEFGVPPNLYIVGTMNTADKSIALLDIALRRRFVFEDIYPRDELVDQLVAPPLNQFLKKLNQQIKDRKGADFTIGHAYFIPEAKEPLDVQKIMNEKVIPLLNEYFYNQKDNPVYNLLKPLEQDLDGCIVEKDEFIGTNVKRPA